VSGGGLFKKLHVGGIVPGQFTAFSNGTLPVDCDDSNYH
jgi:hypothetical protein